MEFFWYDYETWGTDTKRDRPVQFAGVRTDENLNKISEPINLFCKPGLDCPVSPAASKINHILPQDAENKGLVEGEFAAQIYAELTKPRTCTVGYSAMGFDHEITRLLFYRNLRDPYAWHWQNGNSRWDLLPLVRAAHLLRPEVLNTWPKKESGNPSYRLADLVELNIEEPASPPHEALADVNNMLQIARLIRSGAPRLFDHALSLRLKDYLNNEARDTFLWIDSRFGAKRQYAALLLKIMSLPRGEIAAFDLSRDPVPMQKPFGTWDEKDLKNAKHAVRIIRTNVAPFVMNWPIPPKDPRAGLIMEKLQLDVDVLKRRISEVRANQAPLEDFCKFVQEEWLDDADVTIDADEAIYSGGFFSEGARQAMTRLLLAGSDMMRWNRVEINDDRLKTLAFRFRARNYPETLDEAGQKQWKEYCRMRHYELIDKKGRNAMDRFESELASLRENNGNGKDERRIQALVEWRGRVQAALD